MKPLNKIKVCAALLMILASCSKNESQTSLPQSIQTPVVDQLKSGNDVGGQVGNGGDAVVCYTASDRKTVKSVQMFDYWEQENVLHYKGGVDLGGKTLTVQEKITKVVNRINKFDPEVAAKIKMVAMSLADNTNDYLVTSVQLPEIDDAHPKLIPNTPNCYIEQFAVQYPDLVSGQRRFAIAAKFYQHANTSNEDKAGLLLHEAIYRYAILNGATDSDGVRFFNYAVATNKIETLTDYQGSEYLDMINDAKMNYAGCKADQWGNIVIADPGSKDSFTFCYATVATPRPGYTLMIPAKSLLSTYSDPRVRSTGNMILKTQRHGVDLTLKVNEVAFENYANFPSSYSQFYFQLAPGNDEALVNKQFQVPAPLGLSMPCSSKPNYQFGSWDDSSIGIDRNNEVFSCDTASSDFQIAGQVIKIVNMVSAEEPNSYAVSPLNEPIIPVPGSKKNLQVKFTKDRSATFNAQGQLIGAAGIEPIAIDFDGKILTIDEFYIRNGQLRWSGYIPVEAKTPTGELIVVDENMNTMSVAQIKAKMCKEAGFSGYIGSNVKVTTKKVYITKPVKMFSIKTNALVTKADEEVEVFDMLGCQGTISTTNY